VSETPLRIRVSGVDVPEGFGNRTRDVLGRRLGRFATHIEHANVRFEDVNGPRGGVDTICRIQLTVSRRPTVFVERRAVNAKTALSLAATASAHAMDRTIGRAGLATLPPTRPEALEEKKLPKRRSTRRATGRASRRNEPAATARRGRSTRATAKQRKEAPVIHESAQATQEAIAETGPRKPGRRRARRSYVIEKSAQKPSRKSTRKSANRTKGNSKLQRRQRRKLQAPKAKATRARVRQAGPRKGGRV
jgi:hypothetical protein